VVRCCGFMMLYESVGKDCMNKPITRETETGMVLYTSLIGRNVRSGTVGMRGIRMS
jgi:hypothetical protein